MRHLVACILLGLALGACSRTGAAPEQVVTVGLDTNPLSLDPRLARDVPSYRVMQLVFNGLVKKDRAAHLLPDLAASL